MIKNEDEYKLKIELADYLQRIITQIPIWDEEANSAGIATNMSRDIQFLQVHLTKVREEISQWIGRN